MFTQKFFPDQETDRIWRQMKRLPDGKRLVCRIAIAARLVGQDERQRKQILRKLLAKGFVDNRDEGNAPLNVEALVDQLRT